MLPQDDFTSIVTLRLPPLGGSANSNSFDTIEISASMLPLFDVSLKLARVSSVSPYTGGGRNEEGMYRDGSIAKVPFSEPLLRVRER